MRDETEDWLKSREKEPLITGDELLPGTAVGDYKIVAMLGRGGFAEVYKATAPDGVEVAVKMLHRLDVQSRARFERETNILSRLRHASIPRLISFGSCGNRPYLVTELLQVRELPRTDGRVAAFIVKVAAVVGALHEMGYIHRDVKPSNVLWRDGEPVLVDFGLACPKSEAARPMSGLSVVDGQRVVVGTAGFAAPEQFSGGKVDETSDVHALGMLASACFGNNPPTVWGRVIRRASNAIPGQRYQSTAEFVRAIRRRHLVRNAIAAFLVTLVLVLGAVWGSGEFCDWRFDRMLAEEGRLAPPDRSFSIKAIDETGLMSLSEIGIDGWGMGKEDDSPIVLVQKLAYSGDFRDSIAVQERVGEAYGGRTIAKDEEVPGRVYRVEIDDFREGDRLLYHYRKIYLCGKIVYLVSGQTEMKNKERDRAKLKTCVDSFAPRK